VCHVSPEAATGGPIALVEEGDEIELDIPNRRLTLHVPEETLTQRRENWQSPAPSATQGYLARYTTMVASASEGAILK
jgi:dihydroxy-acid dehydratase